MRLGIYGGTFDPVHYGHLLAAEQCREQCALDELWFVPARLPPHKQEAAISEPKARLEMLEFAVAGYPQFVVSRMEMEREGPSYTVETLQRLREDAPERELFFIVGTDSLVDFPTWREPQRILSLATLVVVNRGRLLPDVTVVLRELGAEAARRIQVVTMPAVDVAASDIRQRIGEGRSIRYMTPRAVETYLQEHELYVGERVTSVPR